MKALNAFCVSVFLFCFSFTCVSGEIEIEVGAVIGPGRYYDERGDPHTGPNFQAWVTNGLAYLSGDESALGDRKKDPAAFDVVTCPLAGRELITGDLPVYRGVVNPGEPFAEERGNSLFPWVRVKGNGKRISGNDIDLTVVNSADGAEDGGMIGDYNLKYGKIGIDYGPDHNKNTKEDNKILTSGFEVADEVVVLHAGVVISPYSFSILTSSLAGKSLEEVISERLKEQAKREYRQTYLITCKVWSNGVMITKTKEIVLYPDPKVEIALVEDGMRLSWPLTSLGFTLCESEMIDSSPYGWVDSSSQPILDGGMNQVTLDTAGERRFFKLRANPLNAFTTTTLSQVPKP